MVPTIIINVIIWSWNLATMSKIPLIFPIYPSVPIYMSFISQGGKSRGQLVGAAAFCQRQGLAHLSNLSYNYISLTYSLVILLTWALTLLIIWQQECEINDVLASWLWRYTFIIWNYFLFEFQLWNFISQANFFYWIYRNSY